MRKAVQRRWPMRAAPRPPSLLENAHRHDAAAKISPIDGTIQDYGVQLLQLREGKLLRQQRVRDVGVFELRLQALERVLRHQSMIVRERRQRGNLEPLAGLCVRPQ